MSSKVVCTKTKITAIANKIRSKLSSQDTYTLDEMPAAIESIGGSAVLDQLSVTQNGTYTPPSGTDGYDEVIVNVPATLPEEQLVSEYDAEYDTTNNKGYYYDKFRDVNQPSNHYGNMSISNNQFVINTTGGNCKTGNQFFSGRYAKGINKVWNIYKRNCSNKHK